MANGIRISSPAEQDFFNPALYSLINLTSAEKLPLKNRAK